MNIENVLRVFRIPPMMLIRKEDSSKWSLVIKDYRDFLENDVVKEYDEIVRTYGSDKPIFYYLTAVRRNLIVKQNQYFKTQNMPQQIKDLFRRTHERKKTT